MKVKVYYMATAEFEVSDHYKNMINLFEKRDQNILAYPVWRSLVKGLDRELTWKLPKESEIQKVMTNDIELYEN